MISMFQINDFKIEDMLPKHSYAWKDKCITIAICPEIASYNDKNDINTFSIWWNFCQLQFQDLKQVNKWLQWAVKNTCKKIKLIMMTT